MYAGGGVSVPASTLPAFDWSAGLQLPEGCQFSDGLPIPLGAVPLPDGSVKVPGEMPVRWHDVILPDGVNLDWLLTRPAEEEPQPAATMPDGSAPVALGAWSWFASAKPSVPELAFAGGAGSALAKGASGVAAGVASGSGGGAGGSSGGSGGGGSGVCHDSLSCICDYPTPRYYESMCCYFLILLYSVSLCFRY